VATTFRPDADPETTSVDGQVYIWTLNQTWALLRAGIPDDDFGSLDYLDDWWWNGITITGGADEDRWSELYRGIILFDTSSIPNDAEILNATLSLNGESKQDYLNITPNINIYSANPASNTGLTGTDFNTFGSNAFCDTPISYASWSGSEWNDFVLNSAGIAAISKTGITKIGVRNVNYDVDAVAPAWSSGFPQSGLYFSSADNGIDTAPRLIVTWLTVPTITTQAVTEIHTLYALGNGNITATGGENPSKRGICWKLSSGPTVNDEISEDTGSFSTGAFTNWITPTLPETLYYVKAYAYNSEGYGYGDEVTFTAYAQDGGFIWIETDKFHFIDEIGTEQDLQNFDQDLNTTDSVQFSELLLTPKSSSSGGEGTWFYDSDDNYIWIATE